MTDEEVIAELRSETLWNKARREFSSASGQIDQAGWQRKPLTPIAMRRMEFEAVKRIVAIFGYNSDPHRKCLVKDCPNHNDAGIFTGDLCSPCYEALTGKGQPPSINRIRSSITAQHRK